MKQTFTCNQVQQGRVFIPSQRNTLLYMRENIKELNRSMQSIEKMIQKSRLIIKNSRDNSLDQKRVIQSQRKPKASLIKVDNQNHIKLQENQDTPFNNQLLTQLTISSTQKKSHLSTNSKLITHIISPSINSQKYVKSSVNRQNNKFNTTCKNQINGNQQAIGLNTSFNKLNQTALIKQRLISMSKSIQKLQKQSPFKQIQNREKKIYQFSPQKTNKSENIKSRNRLNAKLAPSNIEKHIKIKQKRLARDVNEYQKAEKKQINLFCEDKKGKDMIRIQDDQEYQQAHKVNQQRDSSTLLTEVKHRYKTEYQRDTQDMQYDYKIREPDNKQTAKKENTIKTNEKSTQNSYAYQKQSLFGYNQISKGIVQTSRASHRQNLVKQLEELETISRSEEERRSKFILKIKKYGFVDKYLTESQIWALYKELTQSKISQLKWPIVIVDQVYKKMKISK